ncbi:GD22016 [Drosophila simulans]|uniref:GD22016 n=1 Tax=Drosophila simulans TaxID=7240 RepID=B4Q5H8_DROSI|nr:GD22016 [Drosophila simulans]
MAQDISLENLAASQDDEMETNGASKGQGRSMGFGEGAEQNGTEQDEPEWDTCAGAP